MSRLNASFTLFGERVPWTDLVLAMRKIKNGLYASALVYGIFRVLAGFWKWLQEARSTTPSADKADKAAVTI